MICCSFPVFEDLSDYWSLYFWTDGLATLLGKDTNTAVFTREPSDVYLASFWHRRLPFDFTAQSVCNHHLVTLHVESYSVAAGSMQYVSAHGQTPEQDLSLHRDQSRVVADFGCPHPRMARVRQPSLLQGLFLVYARRLTSGYLVVWLSRRILVCQPACARSEPACAIPCRASISPCFVDQTIPMRLKKTACFHPGWPITRPPWAVALHFDHLHLHRGRVLVQSTRPAAQHLQASSYRRPTTAYRWM